MLKVLFEDSMSDKLDNDEVKESLQESFGTEVDYNIILRGRDEKEKRKKKKKRKL